MYLLGSKQGTRSDFPQRLARLLGICEIESSEFRRFSHGSLEGPLRIQYEYNAFDHNAVLGPHSAVRNLLFCVGFSGHGSQQAPACGRGVGELIVCGAYRSLEFSELSYDHITQGRLLLERAVI